MTDLTKNDRKIVVFHLITRLNIGGPAKILEILLKNIDQNCFKMKLATGRCESNEKDIRSQAEANNAFDNVLELKYLARSINPVKDFLALIEIIRLLRKNNVDILHTHTFKAGILGRLAGFLSLKKMKVVHTYHGHLLEGYLGTARRLLLTVLERNLAKITNFFLVVGEKVALDLQKSRILKISNFEVVNPSVLLKDFDSVKVSQLRKDFGDNLVVTFVGRLTRIKRPDRLIELARSLRNERVSIVIVGEGELFDELRAIVNLEKLPIIFLGWQSDIQNIYAASDVAILVSENEGVPVSLIEAAAVGLPIIATDVGSVGEVVKVGLNGFLGNFDVENFKKQVLYFRDNRTVRTHFSRESILIYKEKFTVEIMTKAHQRVYNSLIKFKDQVN